MTHAKLLIIHHGALGDVVVTFPAIMRLRKRFSRIDALFQDKLGKLATELNIVDQWFALEAAAFATLYAGSVAPVVKQFIGTYDNIILFSRSAHMQKTINKTTAKKVIFIPPRPQADQNVHVTQHILTNLSKCGLIDDKNTEHNLICSSNLSADQADKKYDFSKILIHPGSGSKKKNWDIGNFIRTAIILESDGMQTEFVLGPADKYLAGSLSVPGRHNRKVHMIDDLKVLILLLKTAGGVIGNDSGIGHLAAFLGLSTLTIFGPSDPDRWRPVGKTTAIVRPDIVCRPCFEINGADCESMQCLTATTPEMVAEAFYKLKKNSNF